MQKKKKKLHALYFKTEQSEHILSSGLVTL